MLSRPCCCARSAIHVPPQPLAALPGPTRTAQRRPVRRCPALGGGVLVLGWRRQNSQPPHNLAFAPGASISCHLQQLPTAQFDSTRNTITHKLPASTTSSSISFSEDSCSSHVPFSDRAADAAREPATSGTAVARPPSRSGSESLAWLVVALAIVENLTRWIPQTTNNAGVTSVTTVPLLVEFQTTTWWIRLTGCSITGSLDLHPS